MHILDNTQDYAKITEVNRMKRFYVLVLFFCFFNIFPPAYCLDDTTYLKYKKASSEFRDAEKHLNSKWKQLKSILNKAEYQDLLKDQRKWLKNRDDLADKLIQEKRFSEVDAYSEITNMRCDYLSNIINLHTGQTRNSKRKEKEANYKILPEQSVIGTIGFGHNDAGGYFYVEDKAGQQYQIVYVWDVSEEVSDFFREAEKSKRLIQIDGTLKEWGDGKRNFLSEKKLTYKIVKNSKMKKRPRGKTSQHPKQLSKKNSNDSYSKEKKASTDFANTATLMKYEGGWKSLRWGMTPEEVRNELWRNMKEYVLSDPVKKIPISGVKVGPQNEISLGKNSSIYIAVLKPDVNNLPAVLHFINDKLFGVAVQFLTKRMEHEFGMKIAAGLEFGQPVKESPFYAKQLETVNLLKDRFPEGKIVNIKVSRLDIEVLYRTERIVMKKEKAPVFVCNSEKDLIFTDWEFLYFFSSKVIDQLSRDSGHITEKENKDRMEKQKAKLF